MKTINETDRQLSNAQPSNARPSVSRRIFAGAAALAGAGFIGGDATAQTRAEQLAGRRGNSPSDPGPENKILLGENPSSNTPPFTNMGWSRQVFDQLPPTHCTSSKLRFPGLSGMPPTGKTAGGETRVVDSANFPVALNIAAAMVTVKPGGLREMHWHPNVSEWQYWIKGKGSHHGYQPKRCRLCTGHGRSQYREHRHRRPRLP
jgi:hypothetical protein